MLLFLWLIPFTAVYFLFGKDSEAKKLKYHTMLHRMAVFFLQRLPDGIAALFADGRETGDAVLIIVRV